MINQETINNGENKKVEFKQELPSGDNIMKTAVAFSNGAGGKLYIGISDDREIIGITENVFELQDCIVNIITDGCYPIIIPEIYTETIDDKLILVVEFYPGNLRPYYIKSKKKMHGTYIRVGASNKQADEYTIKRIELSKRNISFDEEICYDIDLNEINIDKLKTDFNYLTGKKLKKVDLDNLKLVVKEGRYEYPTNGLVLLQATNNIFEYARIKCARFKGNDIEEFIDQKEFAGTLYEQVENAMNFVKQYIPKHGKIRDIQRVDEYEIPLVAVREAIINAVVHRDYSILGADIKCAIFDDRLEITSPGDLPRSLDIQDIIQGRSEIRNRVIARFFREINYIEQWGTGIRRIIKECEKASLKSPDFKESGGFFKVTIFRNNIESPDKVPNSADKVPNSADKVPNSADKVSNIALLTDNEKKIIEYVKEHLEIGNKDARIIIGLKETATKNLLRKMHEKGLLAAVGIGRGRKYVLNNSYFNQGEL